MVSETDEGGAFDRASLTTGGFYGALSIVFIGRALIFGFAHSYVGRGSDPSLFMWSIAWWPYAVSHGLNPILSHVIFVPAGTNLSWTTTIPPASLAVWPLTATCGPVASYNLLALLLPALAAWTTFILCRRLTESLWPALMAGYIFGFSPYILAQTLGGHLHMALIFPVPIALYLVTRWFEREISSRKAACLIGLTLAVQFLFAVEIYATATMFAGLALLIALGSTTGETRRRIFKLIEVLAVAYGVSLLIASPYLYCMFAYARPEGQFWNARQFSADLLNFVIPTDVNLLGAVSPMRVIASTFSGNLFENSAYLGPGLIAIAILYARSHWKESLGKILIDSLIVICVLSLGPVLQVAGHHLLGMPGALLTVIPQINKALPARFMVFAFLALAIMAAQWFAASETNTRDKSIVAILLVIFSLPNLDGRYWISRSDTPEFFSNGIYRKYLSPGENVLITPYSQHGNSMLWQAQSEFYFHMAGGWTGPLPLDYRQWPVVDALSGWTYLPDPRMQLMSFLATYQVGAVVVADGDREGAYFPQWLPPAVVPLDIGGATLYRIAPGMLVPYRSISALTAEREANWALFSGVLAAVAKYRMRGLDPNLMTPYALEHLGMFPPDWVGGAKFDKGLQPGKELYRGVWLSYVDTVHLGIGMSGSYEGLKPIIDRFAPYAYRIFFPFPKQLVQGPQSPDRNILIIFFTPDGLQRAIAANADPAPAL